MRIGFNASNPIIIDVDSRTIPISDDLAGVEVDKNVEALYFKMSKIVGNNIDVSTYNFYINYRNGNNELNQYLIDDVIVEDDNITFSWKFSASVTKYIGNVDFIICLKNSDEEGNILNEWNTKLTTLTVAQGLEATQQIERQYPDVIEQILKKLEDGGSSNILHVVFNNQNNRLISSHTPQQIYEAFSDGYFIYATLGISGGALQFISADNTEAEFYFLNSVSGFITAYVVHQNNNVSTQTKQIQFYLFNRIILQTSSFDYNLDTNCIFIQFNEQDNEEYYLPTFIDNSTDGKYEYVNTSYNDNSIIVKKIILTDNNNTGYDVSRETQTINLGGAGNYVVSITQNSGNFTVDKTYDEIKQAYSKNMNIIAVYEDVVLQLLAIKNTNLVFGAVGVNQNLIYNYNLFISNTNNVSFDYYENETSNFIVTMTLNDDDWVSDRTYEQIKQAYNSGRNIVCNLPEANVILPLISAGLNEINFGYSYTNNIGVNTMCSSMMVIMSSSNVVTVDEKAIALNNDVVTIFFDSSKYASDKDYLEITEAIESGQNVICKMANTQNVLMLNSVSKDEIIFTRQDITDNSFYNEKISINNLNQVEYTNKQYKPVFYTDITESGSSYQSTSSYSELLEAYNNGYQLYARYDNSLLPVLWADINNFFEFGFCMGDSNDGNKLIYILIRIEATSDVKVVQNAIELDDYVIKYENDNATVTSTIQSNRLYVYTQPQTLNITLATPTNNEIANEYHFIFTSGATATNFTIKNQDGSAILHEDYTIEPNTKYEVSVLENMLYIRGLPLNA